MNPKSSFKLLGPTFEVHYSWWLFFNNTLIFYTSNKLISALQAKIKTLAKLITDALITLFR